MPERYEIDEDFEDLVRDLIASGRFANAREVVRAGLRLLQESEAEREARRREIMAKVEEGLADIRAGRTIPAEDVFREIDELIARKALKRAAAE